MLFKKNMLTPMLLVCCIIGMVVVVTGCNMFKDKQASIAVNPPFVITMMNLSVLSEPPRLDDPIIQAIERHTNTKLEIQWVPGSAYNEKLNATIASGEMPMVVLVNDKPQSVINAARAGHFWEIGPYLKDFPHLERAMDKDVLKNLMIDGKVYSIFRSRSLISDGMIYRSDWLENLGMAAPTNLEELYELIKAYTLNDPDENGIQDTIGMGEEKDIRGFDFILAAYGGGNQWELKDGKLMPTYFSEAYLNTLKFYKRLYSEKLMNQDFAITNRTQNIDRVNKGVYGLRLGDPDFIMRHTELLKANSSAELDVTSSLNGVNGVRIIADPGFSGAFMIPKKNVRTEDDLKRILAYYDTISNEIGQNIFEWGIEGIHYSMNNGVPSRTSEQSAKYSSEVIHLQQALQIANGSLAMPGETDKYILRYKSARNAVLNNLVRNPAASYTSNTQLEKSTELTRIITDAIIMYMMGDIDDAGWRQALDKWLEIGGSRVIDEINLEYQNDSTK